MVDKGVPPTFESHPISSVDECDVHYGKTVTSLVSALHYNHRSETNWLK
jgi:hypothetical protein